ncbi:metal-dependent hydrolase [Chitinophaga sp. CF418]|uniref:metal-dependent hydrolase n=1 Tax=Chitinophaga sp. CF418 TaxID=1855287 RepID=UPI0009177424|nr:metal-dependent hydrolase [Chitinophaga sp. CF418]SHN34186.1 L-ascorbate metabolism protein UlaG, beta-lactamase superfamily [Chitinophaga sp. CF418]
MKITYYGHSCFSVVAGGKHLLFDPFISGNELAKHINIDEMQADYIFISHGHFDHILDVVRIANRTGAKVLGVWELHDYFSKQGVKNTQPINPGGKLTFEFGTVKAVSAMHSSSFQDGSYAGVASGFVFKTPDGNFYYSGDTALTMDMTFIPKWAKLDFAVLPIGDGLTMGVEDAIEAAGLVDVMEVVGVHYDTFDFIKIDTAEARLAFEKASLKLHLPEIGQSINL